VSNLDKDVIFGDEILSLRNVVDKLRKDVNKIVVLSSAGYQTDNDVCRNVPGVDVVIGGHSKTFLYGRDIGGRGNEPSTEQRQGTYPVVYNNSGNPCLVIERLNLKNHS